MEPPSKALLINKRRERNNIMEKFEELLRKMGKGWFILKLAEDNGINVGTKTYYGKETAMKARLQRYEATKNIHKEMLDY